MITKTIEQWSGTGDNNDIKFAIDCARIAGHRETVNQNWRWLHDELFELYNNHPDEAAANYSYIKGWIAGATEMLNRALLTFIDK